MKTKADLEADLSRLCAWEAGLERDLEAARNQIEEAKAAIRGGHYTPEDSPWRQDDDDEANPYSTRYYR